MQTSVFHCSCLQSPQVVFSAIKLILLHDPRATCVGWNDSYSVLSVLFICTLTVAKGAAHSPKHFQSVLYSPAVLITAESLYDKLHRHLLALSSRPDSRIPCRP